MNCYFWLAIVLFLGYIEISTTNLVTLWFVISGIITLVLSFFVNDLLILITVFILGGITLLVFFKPLLKNYMNVKSVPTNLDRIIGLTGVVTSDIKTDEIGEVKVDGKIWSAISETDLLIGDKVIVEKIDSVKLVVRKGEKKWVFYLYYL